MKRWQLLWIAILTGVLLVLSACGTTEVEEDTSDDNADPEVIEEETAEEAVEDEDEQLEVEEVPNEDAEPETTEDGNDDSEKNGENSSEQVTDDGDAEQATEVVLENDTFRIFEPAENTVVDNEFTVRGEASTADGGLHYEFEDGHNILDNGSVDLGAQSPDWGEFEFTITFEEVAYESGTVILYEEIEEGSRENQLYIPVTVE